MAITSFPYISLSGDRKITASQEAAGFDLIIDSGVVPGENGFAAAKVSGTLNVTIAAGRAVVAGHRVTSDATETVSVDAGGAQPRIDIIALESNANTDVRACRFAVVKGTPGAAPEVPTLTESAALWQIPLATVAVPAGASTLDSATITDSRVYTQGRHEHAATTITGLQAALNGKQATLASDQIRKVTISSSHPSGGSDGDVWLKYS